MITSRPISLAAQSIDIGLWSLAYWDCGYEIHLGHGCVIFMDVVCWQARTGLCDEPIPLSEESYRASVCVCVCVSEGDQVIQ